MRIQKLFNKETGEWLISMSNNVDIMNVNPIEHFGNFLIVHNITMSGVPFDELQGIKMPSEKKNS